MMLDFLKGIYKKNKNIYFWTKVLRYAGKEEFRNMVYGFGKPDVLLISHPGEKYPQYLVYPVKIDGNHGFFWELYMTLQYLYYADIMHLTPVIEWGKNKFYSEDKPINGSFNFFEYYFRQPSDVHLSEINTCKNLIHFTPGQNLAAMDGKWMEDEYKHKMELNDRFGGVYRKYCRLNTITENYINENAGKLLNGKKTLGIHIRETDFKKEFNNHPVCVFANEYVKPAKELIKKYAYTQIFLATDSLAAVEIFEKEFGNKLVFYKDIHRSKGDIGLHGIENSRKNHHYMLGLEVLRDVYTLTECDSLIGNLSNVSQAACYIKIAKDEEYKETLILEHGINHNHNTINL